MGTIRLRSCMNLFLSTGSGKSFFFFSFAGGRREGEKARRGGRGGKGGRDRGEGERVSCFDSDSSVFT